MPLFEYKCSACGYEFEELVSRTQDSDVQECRKCNADAWKKVSVFSATRAGSTKETIDTRIGREAESRWQTIRDRQEKRRKGKVSQEISAGNPLMELGTKDEKKSRTEYVKTLQKHREERKRKGLSQFTESGAF